MAEEKKEKPYNPKEEWGKLSQEQKDKYDAMMKEAEKWLPLYMDIRSWGGQSDYDPSKVLKLNLASDLFCKMFKCAPAEFIITLIFLMTKKQEGRGNEKKD